ncbi:MULTISPECIES: acyltransferase [Streptomyces]|uniref:Acyltransferase n=1 Tax=Streptomyces chilikensis TaxID=1194079 RepID=A0ABV3EXJ2_9ACTN|nr:MULTISPECIES: acyltransferase [Streptomyces]MDH6226976.1 surface polysaccharide O-acyltransferase-like enzyme [Streptomyces sp. MJP52]
MTDPAGGPAAATVRPAAPAPPAPAPARRDDVDLLRVVCTAAVVLCHTAAAFVEGGHRTAGVAADSLTRFAVPAFFAMAGWAALVASPVRGERQLLRRADRIVRPMAVWTVLYVVWRGGAEDAVGAVLGSVEPAFHLWYLYVYVPLMLVLGAAVLLVRRAAVPRWTLALLGVCALGATARGDAGRITGLDLPDWAWGLSLYPLGYALAGAALLGAARRAGPRWLWAAAVVAGLAAVGAYQLGHRFPAAYAAPPVAALTLAVLGAFRGVRVPERWRGPVRRLSDASFGAYLVHLAFVAPLGGAVAARTGRGWAAVGALTGTALVCAALSFAVAHLWGRLRLRAWLG